MMLSPKGRYLILKIEKSTGIPPNATVFTTREPIFLNVLEQPFELYGFVKPFRRLPDEVAAATSEKVDLFSRYSCGCRLRFKTTSDYIGIHAVFGDSHTSVYMPQCATSGFDLYFYENGNYRFKGAFGEPRPGCDGYFEERLHFGNDEEKDVVIHLPIFTEIRELYVILREGSELLPPSKYKLQKPIVCYGSSIVQGIGASRPGTLYTGELSRRFDADVINLGFGGGAKAEQPIMDYMATMDMCAFIYDYDHNTPSSDYLAKTHYNGYKTIRGKNPDLPIIIASKPDYHFSNVESNERRRQIILATYERAKAEGDEKIWFVDGSKMYPEDVRENCSTDGCHPNDLGYYFMANAFTDALKKALQK